MFLVVTEILALDEKACSWGHGLRMVDALLITASLRENEAPRGVYFLNPLIPSIRDEVGNGDSGNVFAEFSQHRAKLFSC